MMCALVTGFQTFALPLVARFDVAHETRPFVVLAGGGSVTARGTIFDVSLDRYERVTVRLLSGAVDVERPRPIKGTTGRKAVARLEPGETHSFARQEDGRVGKGGGRQGRERGVENN